MGKEDASSIKHWPEDERPRERLVKFGGGALSDAQLLAILIGSGTSE
jgi:DNA repair protein RadC